MDDLASKLGELLKTPPLWNSSRAWQGFLGERRHRRRLPARRSRSQQTNRPPRRGEPAAPACSPTS